MTKNPNAKQQTRRVLNKPGSKKLFAAARRKRGFLARNAKKTSEGRMLADIRAMRLQSAELKRQLGRG